MNSNPPNLFHYATKELSQDAMICWLIKWADQRKGAGPEQEELRRYGRRFIRDLLNHKREGKDPVELENEVKTEIHQQNRRIDVLSRIDEKHVLLIEDRRARRIALSMNLNNWDGPVIQQAKNESEKMMMVHKSPKRNGWHGNGD